MRGEWVGGTRGACRKGERKRHKGALAAGGAASCIAGGYAQKLMILRPTETLVGSSAQTVGSWHG